MLISIISVCCYIVLGPQYCTWAAQLCLSNAIRPRSKMAFGGVASLYYDPLSFKYFPTRHFNLQMYFIIVYRRQ